MKAGQTQNASQFASRPKALQSEMLAAFNEIEGENKKLMSIKTFMLVTLTNFAANTLHHQPRIAGEAAPRPAR